MYFVSLKFWSRKQIINESCFFIFLLDKEEAKHDPNLRHNALLVWAPVDEIPNGKRE